MPNEIRTSKEKHQFTCKTAVVKSHTGKSQFQAFKQVSWPELSRGDCLMEAGATLTMLEDGSLTFHARVWSTDTNDTWTFNIDILTSAGDLLIKVPPFAENLEMKIPNDHTWYDGTWTEGPSAKVAGTFWDFELAVMHYDC